MPARDNRGRPAAMARRFAEVPKGTWDQFERKLEAAGFDGDMVGLIANRADIAERMFKLTRTIPSFRAVHGRWTPLDDLIQTVRNYEGVGGEDIDRMRDRYQFAASRISITGECDEKCATPVIVRTLGTLTETYRYAVGLISKCWGESFLETYPSLLHTRDPWQRSEDLALNPSMPESRFVPNTLSIRKVCFGNTSHRTQIGDLALNPTLHSWLEVLYAASQHPEWIHWRREADAPSIPLLGVLFPAGTSPMPHDHVPVLVTGRKDAMVTLTDTAYDNRRDFYGHATVLI